MDSKEILEVWIDFSFKEGQIEWSDGILVLSLRDWLRLMLRIRASNPPYIGKGI